GILSEISSINENLEKNENKIKEIQIEIGAEKEKRFKDKEEKFVLEGELNSAKTLLESVESRLLFVIRRKTLFEENVKEAVVLVGQNILSFERGNPVILGEEEQEDLRRKIERLKIKLEDIGTGGGADVLKEYKEI